MNMNMEVHNIITQSEREVQNRLIKQVRTVHSLYQYAGNLKDQENGNIREEVLRRFLIERQNLNDTQASETIKKLRDASTCAKAVDLYDANKRTYELLTSRIQVRQDHGKLSTQTSLINWDQPEQNFFEIAEEVTVKRNIEDVAHRRPDLVVYVNGIALAVIELKKDSVSVRDAIRQNIRNQELGEIAPFFSTVQLIMAGNGSEGLWYGVIKTPEKFYLKWKEPCGDPCPPSPYTAKEFSSGLERPLLQMLEPSRFLEFIRHCIIFDAGIKKAARPNQYFALKAAQERIRKRENGIIWHSQGSGKSLTMVWLAKWIFAHVENDPRIVIITDRDELDSQMEQGFLNVDERPYRATSGRSLLNALNESNHKLICTLIHKFGGGKSDYQAVSVGDGKRKRSSKRQMEEFLDDIKKNLPKEYKPKGNLFVFVDECHRTQGGVLHEAMKLCLGDKYMMIGFTGTPLLKTDKATTLEQFGSWIHTYKFDEAVEDGVIRDLRYESRDIEQTLSSEASVDEIFENATKKLTQNAKEAVKDRWATFQKLYSSRDRIKRIVADVCKDFILIPYLEKGRGNAMLVAGSIYQAYRYWHEFQETNMADHCAVVTSYEPIEKPALDEGYSGDGAKAEKEFQYNEAKRMMGDKSPEDYEKWAKEKFIKDYKDMKLLIVVDKLLTGFDAPHATYLYIDKEMRDHNLFQAICRVNRNAEGKDYGYIIDYKDLFNNISNAIDDYTSGAFSGYSAGDVSGVLKNRLEEAKEELDKAINHIQEVCELVEAPRSETDFYHYFVFDDRDAPEEQRQEEMDRKAPLRDEFYEASRKLTRCYLAIATEMQKAGYTKAEEEKIHKMVIDYDQTMAAILRAANEDTDIVQYDSKMRQLLDQYITAQETEVLGKLDDLSFIDVVSAKKSNEALMEEAQSVDEKYGERYSAEVISNNVRRVINRKHDQNPEEYERLSERLTRLLKELKENKKAYKEALLELIEMARDINNGSKDYPEGIDTEGKRAIYDNVGEDLELTNRILACIASHAQGGWRNHSNRQKLLTLEIKKLSLPENIDLNQLMNIIRANEEF